MHFMLLKRAWRKAKQLLLTSFATFYRIVEIYNDSIALCSVHCICIVCVQCTHSKKMRQKFVFYFGSTTKLGKMDSVSEFFSVFPAFFKRIHIHFFHGRCSSAGFFLLFLFFWLVNQTNKTSTENMNLTSILWQNLHSE